MNLQLIGGRRFIVTMLTGLGTTVLVFFGKIDSMAYIAVTLGTVGAFITANTVETVKATNTAANVTISSGMSSIREVNTTNNPVIVGPN